MGVPVSGGGGLVVVVAPPPVVAVVVAAVGGLLGVGLQQGGQAGLEGVLVEGLLLQGGRPR